MRCIHVLKGGTFQCGQCLPCRTKARRTWTHRILLEAKSHKNNAFVTLTYDAQHEPPDYSLVPGDAQKFMKRLRKAVHPLAIRYFIVGEYGELYGRPHFHLIIFGGPEVDILRFMVSKTWTLGRIEVEPLTPERAQYCAKYTTKKMTKKDDKRLAGRHPEFARMSLKPGIGATAVPELSAPFLTNEHCKAFLAREGDVPTFLKTAGRSLPLGRYLRSKISEEVGLSQTAAGKLLRQKFKTDKDYETLRALYEATGSLEAYFEEKGFCADAQKAEQMVKNLAAKMKLKNTRKM